MRDRGRAGARRRRPGAQRDDPAPNAATPAGPATLAGQVGGPHTDEGLPPEVLTGWSVTVGPGGQAGEVRVRVSTPLDPSRGVQLGPWVDLPATPGTYTFPAPHLHWDYRAGIMALDQRTGGHEILRTTPCAPDPPELDSCSVAAVGIFHGLADDDPAEVTATTPAAPDGIPGAWLAIAPVVEVDRDGDRVGDATEEHSKLDVAAAVTTPAADGARRVRIVATNVGSTEATLPVVGVSGNAGPGNRLQPPMPSGGAVAGAAGTRRAPTTRASRGRSARRWPRRCRPRPPPASWPRSPPARRAP